VSAQGLSSLGSAATSFAIDVWVFKQTGSYMLFATLAIVAAVPALVLSAFSGALVDKYPRGRLLIACDLTSALGIVLAAMLVASGRFGVVAAGAVMLLLACVQTVRWPALTSTVTLITPAHQLPRISGFEETVQATATVAAPIVGAALFHLAGLLPIFVLDIATYIVCVSAVLLSRLPMRHAAADTRTALASVFRDPAFGIRWIWQRGHLLRLLGFLATLNLGCAIFVTVQTPLALSYVDSQALATILATGSAGLVMGGFLMTGIGGIQPYQRGVLYGAAGVALGVLIYGLSNTRIQFALGAFLFGFLHPVINSSTQVIWRRETPIDIQGRVFAVRRMISWGLNPLAIALSIPLSKYAFGGLHDWLVARVPGIASRWPSGQTGQLGLMLTVLGVCMIVLVAYFAATGKLNDDREGKLDRPLAGEA